MSKYKSLQAGQLPQEHLSFLQNLLNFIITKYLKQEVNENLSVSMDECSPCGLSITGDIKIYQRHVINENDVFTPNREVPYGLLSRSCFYYPNLVAAAPLYLEIKKFVKVT